MKIAFVSTRGIPNNYGGFEEFAEKLGERLVERGHDCIVYNPSFHAYPEPEFNGIRIKREFSAESTIGTAANFIYDFLSLRDACREEKCDAAIICGYTTAAISFPLLNFRKTKVLTNMDGLEWKRSKWRPAIQRLAKRFERIAVTRSSALIADNEGIAEYLRNEYGCDSYSIPYGADKIENPDASRIAGLDLKPYRYLLLVGRMEPENNFEMILKGIRASKTDLPTVVVSSIETRYGKAIVVRYASEKNIRFLGWVGDRDLLFNLRHFAAVHFHGHSVGGTNPSLLEAMAAGASIAAHDNVFNRAVLGDDALYFSDSNDVHVLLEQLSSSNSIREHAIANNMKKIDELYNWDTIADMYEKMLQEVTAQ